MPDVGNPILDAHLVRTVPVGKPKLKTNISLIINYLESGVQTTDKKTKAFEVVLQSRSFHSHHYLKSVCRKVFADKKVNSGGVLSEDVRVGGSLF